MSLSIINMDIDYTSLGHDSTIQRDLTWKVETTCPCVPKLAIPCPSLSITKRVSWEDPTKHLTVKVDLGKVERF